MYIDIDLNGNCAANERKFIWLEMKKTSYKTCAQQKYLAKWITLEPKFHRIRYLFLILFWTMYKNISFNFNMSKCMFPCAWIAFSLLHSHKISHVHDVLKWFSHVLLVGFKFAFFILSGLCMGQAHLCTVEAQPLADCN